jgi:hypothetical protein
MPVPRFDTRTPLEPLRSAIDATLAEVVEGARFILGPEVGAFEREFAAHVCVLSREQADEVTAAVRDAGLGRPH